MNPRVRFPATFSSVQGPGVQPPERTPDKGADAAVRAKALAGLVQRFAELEKAILELPAIVSRRLEEVASLANEIAFTVAREILGGRIEKGEMDLVPVITSALKSAVEGSEDPTVMVFLNAADLAPVLGSLRPEENAQPSPFRFEVDPLLLRGSFRVETGSGKLKYDPREVLERVLEDVRRASPR